jgi:carbonic anhydrase
VVAQLNSLRAHPAVARSLRRGSLRIHGWVYDIGSGEIHCLDPSTGSFRSLLQPTAMESAREEELVA